MINNSSIKYLRILRQAYSVTLNFSVLNMEF